MKIMRINSLEKYSPGCTVDGHGTISVLEPSKMGGRATGPQRKVMKRRGGKRKDKRCV